MKSDKIDNEDIHYDVEGDDLRRASRANSGTGVEQLQPSMEGKS